MNIIITLPKNLIDSILSGKKKFEMRKTFPQKLVVGSEGFYVVEKGTNQIRCWCRVSHIHRIQITSENVSAYAPSLGVSPVYILNYQSIGNFVYLWQIDYVWALSDTSISSFGIYKNPQSYVYCKNIHTVITP